MNKTIKKTDEEFVIFQEFWKMLQDYYEPEESDEYWKKFLDATVEFEHKHPNNLLCEQLILMLLNYFEKKFRKDKTSSYMKLIKTARWAYQDFLAHSDKKDKEILEEVLGEENLSSEKEIIKKIKELHEQSEVEQLSMFLGG